MASVIGFVRRNWLAQYPPQPPKAENALRFGILGAANIAPMALIRPAKSHPEVVVQAVAARDRTKAEAFAKKHGIPQVLDSYQAILDDPAIDAVYIPLPNGLHFEWALKALAKGKHVLLEKPSVSNATEAELLFRSPLLRAGPAAGGSGSGSGSGASRAPVLLEAFHYRFQPAWQYFMTLVDRPNLAALHAEAMVPGFVFSKDDIRFRYELSGGAMMDLSTYPFSAIRLVAGAEPEACLQCDVQPCPPPYELCDGGSTVRFQFPGGLVGTVISTLRGGLRDIGSAPFIRVTHKPVPAAALRPLSASASASAPVSVPDGCEHVVTRQLTFHNFMVSNVWHRIDVEDEHVVRRVDAPGQVSKRWRTKTAKKIYTFQDAGVADQPSEPYWYSYRHQLEQFVNRIRGREGSGIWVPPEDSIAQARMIDMAYEKSSLPLRPTSKYRPEA